ncbi:MAG TPA: tRNA (guanosine(37)-N1)-methyltransferase TrmD, partial [Glaciecola sp.]|nr:tRNA (guanosine(37)-N1)-methyltransferase TrmD [Glaciecola sp.]
MTQRFSIVTLFPDMFAGCLAEGVMGRAVKSGLV